MVSVNKITPQKWTGNSIGSEPHTVS